MPPVSTRPLHPDRPESQSPVGRHLSTAAKPVQAVDNVAEAPHEPSHTAKPISQLNGQTKANGIDESDDLTSEEEDVPNASLHTNFEDENDLTYQEDPPLHSAASRKVLEQGNSSSPKPGGDVHPSPPTPPKSLYYAKGSRMRFNPEARKWFKEFWIWILKKRRAEGRHLPTVNSVSKMMYKSAKSAGVFMANNKSFQSHRSGQLRDYERIETMIVGRPYERGWHRWDPEI